MFPQNNESLEAMMKPGREAFEYWISFFPTAPLFGVEWRFGDMMSSGQMMPMAQMMTQAIQPVADEPAAKKSAVKPAPAAPKTTAPAAKAPTPETKKPAPAEAVVAEKVAAPAPAPKKPVVKKAAPAKKAAPVKVVAPAEKAPAKKAAPVKTETVAKAPAKKAAPKKSASDGTPKGLFAAKPGQVDDLKMIKGVGPGLEKELNTLGVYQFSQVAGFKKADLEWIDSKLTAFKGRCFRDDWIGQAKALIG